MDQVPFRGKYGIEFRVKEVLQEVLGGSGGVIQYEGQLRECRRT